MTTDRAKQLLADSQRAAFHAMLATSAMGAICLLLLAGVLYLGFPMWSLGFGLLAFIGSEIMHHRHEQSKMRLWRALGRVEGRSGSDSEDE